MIAFFRMQYWRARFWAWRRREGITHWHANPSASADTRTFSGLADLYRECFLMATCKDKKAVTCERL